MRSLLILTVATGLLTTAGCGSNGNPSGHGRVPAATSGDAAEVSGNVAMPAVEETAESGASTSPGSMSGDALPGDHVVRSSSSETTATSPHRSSHSDTRAAAVDRQQQISPGNLTAGSLDDHTGYLDFLKYVRQARPHVTSQTLSNFDGHQIPIHVVSPEGRPIVGARISIRSLEFHPDNRQTPQLRYGAAPGPQFQEVTLQTGSNGRTALVPSLDGTGQAAHFEVVVTTDTGVQVRRELTAEQRQWTIQVDQQKTSLPQQLDLALVIDTTGSMGDELAYLKVEIDSIAAQVQQLFPDVDQRYALILYRDNGDEYVTRTFDFSGSLDEFRAHLSEQQASGGGDYPEAMQAALQQATQLSWRSGPTARVAFLVGDAPPHAHHIDQTIDSVLKLRQKEVTLFPIAASGVQNEAEYLMRISAFLTMGQYLFLTDHSGIGNPHARPSTPEYNVERLDHLMVRMVATELAGEPVLARDIIAVEENGSPLRLPLHHDQRVPVTSIEREPNVKPVQQKFPAAVSPEGFTFWGQPILGLCGLTALALLEFRFAGRRQ